MQKNMQSIFKLMKIIVGSTNPVKVSAVQEAVALFGLPASVRGVSVPSGVSPMPLSRQEVRKGAKTRAINALSHGATLAIGMEGGIAPIEGQYYLTSSVYACTASDGAWGGEILVRLPEDLVSLVLEKGMELGDVIDLQTGLENSKQGGGAVSYLTGGRLTRQQVFRDSCVQALAPLLQSI